MKQIKIKEIETTPLILSILLWYLSRAVRWIQIIGGFTLFCIGVGFLAIALDVSYQFMLCIITAIAAAETGWIVYKAFKTGKVKWKRKKKGEEHEHF